MTDKTRHYFIRIAFLFICMLVFGCNDFNCKEIMSGSPLRRYTPEDRIKKINKELSVLTKNEKDLNARKRLGDLHEQLASIYIEKEDGDTSLVHINKAFEYGRNNPYLNYIAGLVYGNRAAKTGSKYEIDKAEDYYRKAVAMKEDYDDAWYSLAVLLFLYKNEREEPIKIMEKLYVKSRSNYRVRFALGRFYYESGRKEDALEIYKVLQTDLEKLPKSPMTMEYIKISKENIQKLQLEMQRNE